LCREVAVQKWNSRAKVADNPLEKLAKLEGNVCVLKNPFFGGMDIDRHYAILGLAIGATPQQIIRINFRRIPKCDFA